MNSILLDAKYATFCRYVSNNSFMWEDLYQEFRIKVLTEFKKIQSAESPEAYCRYIIHSLWKTGRGYGHGSKSDKMLLSNYSDTGCEIREGLIPQTQEQTDYTEHKKHLKELLKSSDSKTKRQAEIFNKVLEGKNRLEVSKQTGINYRTVHDAVRETAQTIKTNMTKNEIKSRLLAEGISSSYSGKDKTFYTNKKPSLDLEKKIIESGFKQQKK